MTMKINLTVETQKMKHKKSKIEVSTRILVVSLITPRVQYTIKINCYSGIKCDSQSQQRNLHKLQNK